MTLWLFQEGDLSLWFVIARLILSFTVLGYAGYADLKCRLVDNQVWRDFAVLILGLGILPGFLLVDYLENKEKRKRSSDG